MIAGVGSSRYERGDTEPELNPPGSPMRIVVLALTFALFLLPVLLILFAPGKPLKRRILWAVIAFLAPISVFGLVRMVPVLSNNAPSAAQWERFVGLLLTGGGAVMPWIIFALFLHLGRRA